MKFKGCGLMVSYKTIKDFTSCELVEKKSRFIGHIKPIVSEQEAMNFVQTIKREYKDAKHNVWAFNLKDNMTRRYCDDKEPKGTAGIPILDVLLKEGIKDACIVVTRYFGGTLLGASGLVRAYGSTASLVIKNAQIIVMNVYCNMSIIIDYNMYDKIEKTFPKYKMKIIDVNYTNNVQISCIIKFDNADDFKEDIKNMTNGKAKLIDGEKIFTYI